VTYLPMFPVNFSRKCLTLHFRHHFCHCQPIQTTAVTSCSDEMTKWAKCNGYDKPRFCFINMAATSSTCKGGIMRATLKKIAKSLEIDGASTLLAFEKQFKNKAVVLVLDEIDMMFKQLGGIAETWFQTLVDWAEDKQMRFSMIGISNCVNDINATRIRELGHVSNFHHFLYCNCIFCEVNAYFFHDKLLCHFSLHVS